MNIKTKYLTMKYQMICKIPAIKYKFKHWLFSWNQDEGGDIVFTVVKILHFIKYKEHTIIKFGKMNYQPAPKYVQCGE